jgi:hypothetical protein
MGIAFRVGHDHRRILASGEGPLTDDEVRDNIDAVLRRRFG